MECTKCDREAVMHAAYSGAHLCEPHLLESVERRITRRIREDALLPDDATPADPVTWVLALSGGKDSAVMTDVIADTFAADPRVELVALTIHEGIEGYRDESLAACRELVEGRDIRPHEVVDYADELGVEMDDVAQEDPLDMAPCAYCGVFRRTLLDDHARRLDADLLLTGHNLDDEAQTALMNVLEGDLEQMAKHFDASLGPLDERGAPAGDRVPRAKPLRDVPEKEIALYARLADLPAHVVECPHASESFRDTLQDLLLELEADHPGTRHSIMSGYEELAAMAAEKYRDPTVDVGECVECGAATRNDRCRSCQLLAAVAEN
ncbi:MAG: TIGR00269 family protein [Halobacteriaceae archaeon]